jgi:hypothetical protein
MAATNDVTGDPLITKPATKAYRDNYDLIFRSRERLQYVQTPLQGGVDRRCSPDLLGLPESDESDQC